MADNSGGSVIIDASLNASAMESAINILVADVDYKMGKLAEKFDQNITKMENSMGRMKKTSKDTNVSQNTQETKSVSELGESYDKLASQMQAAAAQSAKRWDVSPIQSYRMQLHELEAEINRLQNVSWNQGYEEWTKVGRQIQETRSQIQQLVQEQEKLKSSPTANRFEEQQRLQQYQQLGEQIDALKSKEAELVASHGRLIYEFARETPAGRQLNQIMQKYDDVKQKIREMGNEMEGGSFQKGVQQQTQQIKQLGLSQDELARQTAEAEAKRREEIMQTGLTAQQTARQLMATMSTALQNDAGMPILGIKELDAAIRQMSNAYWNMGAGKESPIGVALKQDLDAAQKLRFEIKKYNMELMGLGGFDESRLKNNPLYEIKKQISALSQEYANMNRKERDSARGQELIDKFQRLSRAAQEVNNQLNRPLNLDKTLKLPEKTLDDIIYKMQQLSSYRLGINVDSKGVPKEIQDVNAELDRLSKRKNDLMGQNQKVTESNNALTRSFNYMKNRLAFYFTVGASTQFVKNLIEVRSQYELLEKSIGILVGSMQEGSRIFNELNSMAIKSPFTTMELGAAAKQLTAYDVAANEVVNTTKRLADMAAAVGVPIQRLTYALGQVKAYDYLNARDARMFASAGIPLVKELAQYYTELEGRMISTADVYSRMKKRMISYNDTMAVVNKLTDEGGKFFNYQEKMAGTLRVQLANLTLAWNNALNSLGKSNQSIIAAPIVGLKLLFKNWSSISKAITDVVIAFGLLKAAQIIYLTYSTKTHVATAMATAANWKLVDSLVAVRSGLTTLMSNPMTWWMLLISVVVSATTTLIDANSAIKDFNKSIIQGAKENAENISSFLDDYSTLRERLGKNEVMDDEASKTWEAVKEQIELTAGASDIFINKLMAIDNINDRLKAGFAYLEDVKTVAHELERIGLKEFSIQQDYSSWWNLGTFYDSLYENVQDFTQAQKRATESTEEFLEKDLTFGNLIEDSFYNANEQLETLQKNITKTSESLDSFIKNKGWSGNVDFINEAYGQIGKKIATEGLEKGWSADDVFNFQMEWEEKRSDAARKALQVRVMEEEKAWYAAEDEKTAATRKAIYERDKEQLDSWYKNNGRGRVIWTEFCKWMNETHSTEVKNMYNKMTENGTKAIDYSSDEWNKWIFQMSDKFKKDHKMSQDDVFNHLYKWVLASNNWETFIKIHIVSDGYTSIYDTLTNADKAADDAYNKQKRLRERIKELDAKIDKATREKDYNSLNALVDQRTKALGEEKEAVDALTKAEEKGGKSKAKEADAKKQASAANKKNAAARRAQAKAESELQKAFKDELQILDQANKEYKNLTKAGLTHQDALSFSTQGFEKSISHINSVFKKWGIKQFDLSKYAGYSNPREILSMLEQQLNAVVKKAKPEEINELEAKIKEVRLEAEKFDMKKITDGLNNELSKIKEEYELAVELDANPELGEMFAESFGIDTTKYPKTVQEAVDRMQDAANKAIAEHAFGEGIDIDVNDLMHPFDILQDDIEEWSKATGIAMDSNLIDSLKKLQKESRDLITKDAKETISDWQKLLEKYAEYETKKAEIQKRAEKERQTAREHNASQEIMDAIDLKEVRELSKLDFDEFQKTAYWITATGDLSRLSNSALQMLIDKLGEYKKAAKNLDPKDINKLNNAMRKLRKEQRKNNPFSAFAISMDEAKERMEQFEPDIQELGNMIERLQKKWWEQGGWLTAEDEEKLERYIELYNELIKMQKEAGKVPFADKMKDIGKVVNAFKDFSNVFKEIADSTNDFGLKQTADAISDVIGNFEAAEKGAETWGGWWGAIIGGVTDAIPKILKWVSGNAKIDYDIQQSQIAVKKLANTYKELEHAAQHAYGVEAYGAQKTLIINKQLQLSELENQLRLEKSRKKKYKDKAAIADIEGQIIDLKNEINEATESIANGLLGITSKADFAENLVSSMIQAFKAGEDYMKVFEDSFEDMVDNMIMKAIVSRLVGEWINSIWDMLDAKIAQSDRVKSAERDLTEAENKLQGFEELVKESPTATNIYLRDMWRKKYEEALAAYNDAITPTPEDIASMRDFFEQGRDEFKNNFLAYMDAFGIKFGENAGKADLSALQQGIQGITEDTAGALEAYMNGVSQQVYYQSDILTQIRDILVNFGGDVTIATNAQMLFQLQQSFQVQMTIQNVLTGVLNASGLAFRVELVS